MARDLGARGSRAAVAGSDPAAALPAAALAVLAAIPAWWKARARAAGLSGRWLDVYSAIDADPPDQLDAPTLLLELQSCSAAELGEAYVAALTPEVHARHGRHYTPPELADHLWAMTRKSLGHLRPARPLSGLVRDPACGAAALLLPVIREHVRALVRADARVVLAGLPNVVEGVDADPAAVWIANVVLAAEALPVLASVPSARRRPLPALARIGDGLQPSTTAARVVLMNPPYGRVRLSPEDRDRFARVLYGHANLTACSSAPGSTRSIAPASSPPWCPRRLRPAGTSRPSGSNGTGTHAKPIRRRCVTADAGQQRARAAA